MADRTDIDALLIGALYGELTPADEARLTGHLESHPADRTALADLTRTRAAVHGSRILAASVEPPQAISALLLQEASRRAPRAEARTGRIASWFHRFTRSFVAHPAMAAAAMLVLVLGVAGTLYVRGIDLVARSPAREAPVSSGASAGKAEVALAAAPRPAVAAAPSGSSMEPGAATAGEAMAAGPPVGAGSLAGSGSSPAEREDRADPPQALAERAPAQDIIPSAAPSAAPIEKPKAALAKADRDDDLVRAGRPVATRRTADFEADRKLAQPAKKLAGIEVRSPELAPRELKDSGEERPERARRPSADPGDDGAIAVANERVQGRGAGAASGGGAAPAAAAPAPEPPAAVRSSPPALTGGAPARAVAPEAEPALDSAAVADKASYAKDEVRNEARNEAKKPSPRPASAVARPQGAPAAAPPPPPPPPATADSARAEGDQRRFAKAVTDPGSPRDVKTAAQKPAGDEALRAWARKQHGQVIALVGANDCRAAASAAIEIYRRAPGYYATSVVTDRSIKPCLAQLDSQREREERSRAAAKSAPPADTPATASPPARK